MSAMDALVREIMSLRKSLDDLDRRLTTSHMTGNIAQIDGNRVRIELMDVNSKTGEKFLSPWVQVQEAAGASSTHFPVKVGDPMRLFSPNGELGSQSIAIRDSYTETAENKAEGTELYIGSNGCVLRFSDGHATIEASSIDFKSKHLTHNGTNIGDTHRHGGVERGGANTNEPH